MKNIDLIRYLLQQGRQSKDDRVASLCDFYPAAQADDWQLIDAGIRVQAIKSTEGKSGIVHYGTEVVTDPGKSIAALLGTSPGASVSASIAIRPIQTCLFCAVVTVRHPASSVRRRQIAKLLPCDSHVTFSLRGLPARHLA